MEHCWWICGTNSSCPASCGLRGTPSSEPRWEPRRRDDRHADEIEPTVLTDFQVEVAWLFFSLPASDRFLLAGGAALLTLDPLGFQTQS